MAKAYPDPRDLVLQHCKVILEIPYLAVEARRTQKAATAAQAVDSYTPVVIVVPAISAQGLTPFVR